MVCIAYIDDCLFFLQKQSYIDLVLDSFAKYGPNYNWEMTVDGSVAEFLGIDINRLPDVVYQFLQSGLTQRVRKATKMTDFND